MTPTRTYLDYLHDMLDHIQMAQQFTSGIDYRAFCANREKSLAVIRALEVIGEAARSLPSAVQDGRPDVPWRNLVGMRDVLIHHYFGVDLEVVWKTVHEDLPSLREAVSELLANLEAEQ